jgi:glutathione S-transferase
MIKLYQMAGCPFAWRTRIVLGEKALPFETVFFEPGRRPPELDALGPHAKSPTLVDGDVALWESLVINEYLEDRYPEPRLLPADPADRARTRLAVAEVDKILVSGYRDVMREMVFKPADKRDQRAVADARAKWGDALAHFDRRLAGRPFLAGDRLSLADVMLYTPIPTLQPRIGEDVPASLVHLLAWLERMAARPAMQPVAAPARS